MITTDRFHDGDLFLDYGVSGNKLSRSGLDALIETALRDRDVSHILIPRRDRLARPDDPLDAVKLEDSLRRVGLTLVFMDKVLPPMERGSRRDMAELITTLFDYDASGKFRRDLAQKMIYTQTALARLGFSVGGRPPYGFDRWLIGPDEQIVRKLDQGETVRRHGYHVVWLPAPDDDPRMQTTRRILLMLETTPAARVARAFTEEGLPSPDAGRLRKDNGILHRVSGVWHQTTITNIARNPLLLAVMKYGRRSMGDQARFSIDGPRELDESDLREDGQAKVIQNAESQHITAPAKFDPVVDRERHMQLLAKLDHRGGTQRGKPRSRRPSQNPLGSRVYDMDCGWLMYRTPYQGGFRYTCGLYQQSHAAQCQHNHIDGLAGSRFVLATIRQRILKPSLRGELERWLRQRAERESATTSSDEGIGRIEFTLSDVQEKLDRAAQNMALADGEKQFQAMAAIFDSLQSEKSMLESERLALISRMSSSRGDVDSEVAKAINTLSHLPELAGNPENLAAVGQMFIAVNARMFCRFTQKRLNKRTVNKLSSGVIAFGDAAPPIKLYEGPTARRHVNKKSPSGTGPDGGTAPEQGQSDSEGESSGNVSRDDRI